MYDWNVVVSVHEHGYTRARHLLERLGAVARTEFFNVLVMRIEDPDAFLEQFADLLQVVDCSFVLPHLQVDLAA